MVLSFTSSPESETKYLVYVAHTCLGIIFHVDPLVLCKALHGREIIDEKLYGAIRGPRKLII